MAPPPLRGRAATFATQADALLRKNGRYQMTNWCACHGATTPTGHLAATLTRLRRRKTNCCLVLTPLVFSVVLGGAGAWRM